MHTVIETPWFIRRASEAGMDAMEISAVVARIGMNPTAGDLIQETSGLRKVRFPGKGKGKSGGYRVITFYASEDVPIFLMDVYSKGAKINLTKREKKNLATLALELAEAYQKKIIPLATRRRGRT